MTRHHTFLTRTRTERRALQVVNEIGAWPALHGLGEPARRAWLTAMGARADLPEVRELDRALMRLQTAARLDVDRSQFSSPPGPDSAGDVAVAVVEVEATAVRAARAWKVVAD